MALGNTPRRETTFAVEANKSYAFGMRFVTPDGNPVDITASDIRMILAEPTHSGGTELLKLSSEWTDPTAGITQFNLQAEDLALEPGSYPFDITMYAFSGYSVPILKGYFEVGSNTDYFVDNNYEGVDVGSDITITFEAGDVVNVTIERVDGLYVIVASLIEDFTAAMAAEVAKAEAAADTATEAAELVQAYSNDMQAWLDNAGFPFWKGTYAAYQGLLLKEEVLYLITDEAV